MTVQKTTDPNRIVTDPVLLGVLAKQGIDKDYVEFYQDYAPACVDGKRVKGQSPYAKFYRDLLSGKRFMVCSGLPMVTPEGWVNKPLWLTRSNIFISETNLFHAQIDGTQITLESLYDTNAIIKKGAIVKYNPQFFIGVSIVQPTSPLPTMLNTDPQNPNMQGNVLEWDYGVCKRRVRLIQGAILGYWQPTIRNISGDVRIKYNQTGDYPLMLGQYAINKDKEYISREEWAKLYDEGGVIQDSTTFYPVAAGDAWVRQFTNTAPAYSWNDVVTGAGNTVNATDTYLYTQSYAFVTTDRWRTIVRSILVFVTSGLPDTANVSAATLSLRSDYKSVVGATTPANNIYHCTPANVDSIVAGDYDSMSGDALCDTAITYANWDAGDVNFNDFVLNAAGIATDTSINRQGSSFFMLREVNYDVANSAPPWGNGVYPWTIRSWAMEKGAGYEPKLVVTYSMPTAYVRNSRIYEDNPVPGVIMLD